MAPRQFNRCTGQKAADQVFDMGKNKPNSKGIPVEKKKK